MSKIIVLGAGGPAGVNTCRALFAAGHYVIAADDDADHLVWCERWAQDFIPSTDLDLAEKYGADFIIAQPDNLVQKLADAVEAGFVKTPTLLPRKNVIALCQDKWEFGLALRRVGLREDKIHLLQDDIQTAEAGFDLKHPFWVRARRGAGARGALLAQDHWEAVDWVGFWQHRYPHLDFVAEAYLPGRDLAWSSIWYHGKLITSFLRERLEYIYPHLSMEGKTGTPTIARIVHDDHANAVAQATVEVIDDRPHGIYSVDMVEAEDGYARPTEINAGRGFTTLGLWSVFDQEINFLDICVKLELVRLLPDMPAFDALPEGLTLSRHIDCEATFTLVGVPQPA